MSAVKRSRFLRLFLRALGLLVIAAAVFAGVFYWQMRRSLPQLDGGARIAGLTAEVTIERDAAGVPTVRGATRADVARALGFLHAQDRFFQMDLSRRSAAGELAELVGKAALPLDREARRNGFRRLARTVLGNLPAPQRALLEAYAGGVNTGLAGLRTRPFEYLVLRTAPQPWLPEDSVLVIYAMTIDLQDAAGGYERSLSTLRDRLGMAGVNFFAPLIGPDDVALDGSTAPLPPIPSARVLDLRKTAGTANDAPRAVVATEDREGFSPGSNSLALAGALTASGAALLANDMHLSLRVPTTWYRASLVYPATAVDAPRLAAPAEIAASAAPVESSDRRITGVTLPGVPVVVAGSNGRIAWGFTNAYTDTSDLVPLLASDIDRSLFLRGQEILALEKRPETIRVKGGEAETVDMLWSPWGPVVGRNEKEQHLALKWTAHDPAATNLDLLDLEAAGDVSAAIAVAHRAGIPAQNFLVADAAGAIGWTIAGKLPKRVGFDGRLPVSWTFGDRRWDGFLSSAETPTRVNPPAQRLSTANQRLVGGENLARLGDGGYEPGQRASRVAERLATVGAAAKAGPADLLAVQLDARATYLDYWHTLMLGTLTDAAVAEKTARRELREALAGWAGRAEVDSASYRLVRTFRAQVRARVFTPIFASCVARYPEFSYHAFHLEAPLRKLIEEKPAHLLAPEFLRWEDLLLAAADGVSAEIDKAGLAPAEATWGRRNVAAIRHPLSRSLPGFLSGIFDLPAEPLAGDRLVPRVQAPAFGASERFAVSPGREAEGIFHMPGGQSGHPLSPFYRAGHAAWVRGEATPFLPGATAHTLVLKP